MMPRLSKFRVQRYQTNVPRIHVVLVTGDEIKTVCTRQKVRQGGFVSIDTEVNCDSCKNRGWIYQMGPLNNIPVPKDSNGRYISREAAKMLEMSEN